LWLPPTYWSGEGRAGVEEERLKKSSKDILRPFLHIYIWKLHAIFI
jgi:hypothetical protein